MRLAPSLRLALLFAVPLLGGCSDLFGPDEEESDLSLDVTRTREQMTAAGQPAGINCNFQIEAKARDRVTWRNSTLYFAFGPDGEVFDSIAISAHEMGELFGEAVDAGSEAVATLTVSAAFPFELTGEMRYTGGRHGVAEFKSSCGPSHEPGGAPIITSFEVVPDTLEMGRTFQVEYSVISDVPLWGTWIIMSGAHNETISVAEGLALSATRTVDVHLRHDPATIGESVTIRLETYDAALSLDGATRITPPITFELAPGR